MTPEKWSKCLQKMPICCKATMKTMEQYYKKALQEQTEQSFNDIQQIITSSVATDQEKLIAINFKIKEWVRK